MIGIWQNMFSFVLLIFIISALVGRTGRGIKNLFRRSIEEINIYNSVNYRLGWCLVVWKFLHKCPFVFLKTEFLSKQYSAVAYIHLVQRSILLITWHFQFMYITCLPLFCIVQLPLRYMVIWWEVNPLAQQYTN